MQITSQAAEYIQKKLAKSRAGGARVFYVGMG